MATRVRDVMSPPPPVVLGSEPVMIAAQQLRAQRAAAVPIRGDNNRFLGMLTTADIINRCVADGLDTRVTTTASLLTGCGTVLSPGDVLDSEVLSQLLAQGFSSLPVLDSGGTLVGLLTVDDVAGYLLTIPNDEATGAWPEPDFW